MQRTLCLTSIVVWLAIAAGCATIDVTKTGKGFFEPTRADDVQVLMSLPDRRYEEVASISTRGWSPNATAKMHNALRSKAAPMGANAVVLQNSGIDANGLLWSTGMAIRYK